MPIGNVLLTYTERRRKTHPDSLAVVSLPWSQDNVWKVWLEEEEEEEEEEELGVSEYGIQFTSLAALGWQCVIRQSPAYCSMGCPSFPCTDRPNWPPA